MDGPSTHADDVFARLRDFAQSRRHEAGTPSDTERSRQGMQHNGRAAEGVTAPGRKSDVPAAPPAIQRSGSAQEAQAPHGRCELCSLPLTEVHRHLFEVASGEVVCACDGCALTFQGVADGRYKPVPRDARALDDELAAAIPWEQLSLPINLAFFVREGEAPSLSAYYPSPGGVTKSTLPFDFMDDVLDAHGILSSLEPHVEALLVNRLTQKVEAFVVPIDQCYELTGLIRVNWRGFSGGEDVRREMTTFFDRVRSRARPIRSA